MELKIYPVLHNQLAGLYGEWSYYDRSGLHFMSEPFFKEYDKEAWKMITAYNYIVASNKNTAKAKLRKGEFLEDYSLIAEGYKSYLSYEFRLALSGKTSCTRLGFDFSFDKAVFSFTAERSRGKWFGNCILC